MVKVTGGKKDLNGMRGSHILNVEEVVSLKNIEELVQDREAI